MGYTLTTPAFGYSAMSPKNRVWDFFRLSNETHPANRRQPAQPRRKLRPVPTKTASGIPYWPSRDLIEEEGGVNLYGFVTNRGVSFYDVLGLTEELKLASKGAGSIDPNNGQFAASGYTVHESRDKKGIIDAILKHFDTDGDGDLDEDDECPWRIRMVGYSWGGWTVLMVVRDLKENGKIKDKSQLRISLGTLDPIGSKRGWRIWGVNEEIATAPLPDFVKKAFNVYQRNGAWRQRIPLPAHQFKGSWVNGAMGLKDANQDYSNVDAGWANENNLDKKKQVHDHISIQDLADDLVSRVDKVDLK